MDVATATTLSDDDFIAAFEARLLDDFPHRFHLRVAWIYINRLGVEGAIARLRSEIQDLASGRGQGTKYHETITQAWTYVVAHAAADVGQAAGFEGVLQRHPELLDKHLLLKHYRPETLGGTEARQSWVAPDVRELPAVPNREGRSRPR
jgi:hypothetical protein